MASILGLRFLSACLLFLVIPWLNDRDRCLAEKNSNPANPTVRQAKQESMFSIDHPSLVYEIKQTDSISALAFSPDGSMLASAALDNALKICDTRTGREIRTLIEGAKKPHDIFPDGHRIVSMSFSPDGRILASAGDLSLAGRLGGGEVRLWNPASGKLLRNIVVDSTKTAHTRSVVFLPGGKAVLTALEPDRRAEISEWDVQNGALKRKWLSLEERIYSITISPNGRTLAIGFQGEIALFDIQLARWTRTVPEPRYKGLPFSLSYSPDGDVIAGTFDGPIPLLAFNGSATWGKILNEYLKAVHLWNGQGVYLGRMNVPQPGSVTAVAFSPDGQLIAIGCNAAIVRVYRIK